MSLKGVESLLSYHKENLREVYFDIEKMLKDDAMECDEPFLLDMNLLLTYNDSGFRRQYLVKDGDKIVGQSAFYFSDNTRGNIPTAQEERWYLLPEYRKGWTVVKLWRFIEQDLKKDGAEKIMITIDPKSRIKNLLTRQGFELSSMTYEKEL